MVEGQIPIEDYETGNTKHTWDTKKIMAAHKIIAEYKFKKGEIKRGYANRTLYINLSTGTIKEKPVTEEMKKKFAIVAVIAVIIVSAAVAITVANMSDAQGNLQRYEISNMSYFYDSIAQSTISSSQVNETEPEISYDDGNAEHNFTIDLFPQADIGHAVLFTPPSKPWTLEKVRVYGKWINLSGGTIFALEIWDNDSHLLYKLTDYSLAYFNPTLKWTKIDIPDINITDDFYVCFFERGSIAIGADIDKPAKRSFIVIRDPKNMVNEEFKDT